ncbi:hypothetical protein HY546_00975, partial [archaeon]|nr:hypothetical protein [archaeon]
GGGGAGGGAGGGGNGGGGHGGGGDGGGNGGEDGGDAGAGGAAPSGSPSNPATPVSGGPSFYIQILSPDPAKEYRRLDTINIATLVIGDSLLTNTSLIALAGQKQVLLKKEGDLYTGQIKFNASDSLQQQLHITGAGFYFSNQVTMSNAVPLKLNKAQLLANDSNFKLSYRPGEVVKPAFNLTYQDGSAPSNTSASAALTGGDTFTAILNATSRGFEVTRFESKLFSVPYYTVSVLDSERGYMLFDINVSDQYDNSGEIHLAAAVEPLQAILSVNLISPQTGTLAYGQMPTFKVKVLDFGARPVSSANVVMLIPERGLIFKMPNMGRGVYEKTIQVSSAFNSPLIVLFRASAKENFSTSLPSSFDLSNNLNAEFEAEFNSTLFFGQTVRVRVSYPDGSPITSGEFFIKSGNESLRSVTKTAGIFEAPLNFTNRSAGLRRLRFEGADSFGNRAAASIEIQLEERPFIPLFVWIAIAAVVAAFASFEGYAAYKRSARHKYAELVRERSRLEDLDKRVHLDFYKRRISELDLRNRVLEIQSRAKQLDREIAEYERKHKFRKPLKTPPKE